MTKVLTVTYLESDPNYDFAHRLDYDSKTYDSILYILIDQPHSLLQSLYDLIVMNDYKNISISARNSIHAAHTNQYNAWLAENSLQKIIKAYIQDADYVLLLDQYEYINSDLFKAFRDFKLNGSLNYTFISYRYIDKNYFLKDAVDIKSTRLIKTSGGFTSLGQKNIKSSNPNILTMLTTDVPVYDYEIVIKKSEASVFSSPELLQSNIYESFPIEGLTLC